MSEAMLAQIEDMTKGLEELVALLGAKVAVEEEEEESEVRQGVSFADFKRVKSKAWTQDGNAAPDGSGWLTDGHMLLKEDKLERKPPYKSMREGAVNGKVRIEAIEHLFNGAVEEKAERWRGTRDEWVIDCNRVKAVMLMSPGNMEKPVAIDPSKASLIEYLIPGVEYWCKLNDTQAPIHLQLNGELVGLLMPLRVDPLTPKAWSGVTEVTV